MKFQFIPILPVRRVQTHIRSVRGSNPCTATNYFLLKSDDWKPHPLTAHRIILSALAGRSVWISHEAWSHAFYHYISLISPWRRPLIVPKCLLLKVTEHNHNFYWIFHSKRVDSCQTIRFQKPDLPNSTSPCWSDWWEGVFRRCLYEASRGTIGSFGGFFYFSIKNRKSS